MDDETRHYLDTLTREMRAGFAELRASMAQAKAETAINHLDLTTRINTLTDSIADLRREYNDHWHPPTNPPPADN